MLLEDFYITMPVIPEHTAVLTYLAEQEQAAKAPHSTAKSRRDPAWVTLCILAGAFLSVAAGVFLITLGSIR